MASNASLWKPSAVRFPLPRLSKEQKNPEKAGRSREERKAKASKGTSGAASPESQAALAPPPSFKAVRAEEGELSSASLGRSWEAFAPPDKERPGWGGGRWRRARRAAEQVSTGDPGARQPPGLGGEGTGAPGPAPDSGPHLGDPSRSTVFISGAASCHAPCRWERGGGLGRSLRSAAI